MPSSQAYRSSLVTFGRHTPRTLRQQLLCQLALQYLGIKEGNDILTTLPEDPRPSISRFHGALLFVDISGFTALSLRLKVEDLKNHINEYFATMLNIVDKWDGDVIKFAGDALYVVWKTDLSMIKNEEEDGIPARLNKFYSKDKWARLPAATGKVTPENENVAYLNVHAGVSFGLMAGVDIGALDRWEYFLIGKPLHRVAEAEEEAAKGDIVICPEGTVFFINPFD
ncbi:adenylate/guanylate cyclase domain-containing protein [archaeon]|nr:MAG: adenylate/guanylate cyclase domain-containing protein [archaeon]